ncbi:uncharacterized protein ColSpa_08135 [Colletotrichum spaethianum]|uniref:Uncharacterized protein n=1 Tax=Colletotrichum spaethianum TaxID=700344 RepID=A0AA37UIG0_9PEZI|nr:uncharacterized protein ColSpa_08135 [Colletotrichum spaethianum]GKT47954.1 hypothetical protein ColSpa_08135 [Colletotrichum spaethianum]
MFRLAIIPAFHGRQLLAGLLPPAFQAPAHFMETRRTFKQKVKLRPSPQAKKTSRSDRPPAEVTVEPRRLLSDFQIRIKESDMKHVTAQEAHGIYTKYMKAVAVEEKPADWQERLVKDSNASAAKLHETATLILTFPQIHSSEFEISCGMLNAAAGLGDDAAALSLGRMLQHTESKHYFQWDQPRWRNTRERCRVLIEEGRDASALVLKGLIHLSRKTSKDDSLALEAFVQAEKLGKDADQFDWEPACLEGQGEACLRLKDKKKAEEAFTRLVDLDCARGFYRLAKMFPRSESTLDWLTKAAASGLSETYELLVDEHERLRSICMSQGREEEARRHERDAAEWTLIMRAKATRGKELDAVTKSN